MYWFWLFYLYPFFPFLLLPGLFGFFGKEAEKAANDFAIGGLILVVLIFIGVAVYTFTNFLSRSFGF